jgi:hypothetical protein
MKRRMPMDITTKLIELAYSKPEIERERFLRELPNVVILPDFEEKLFLFLFRNATQNVKRRIVGGGFGGLFSANSPTARRFHPGECGLSAEIWRTSSGGRKRTRGLISAEEAPLLK